MSNINFNIPETLNLAYELKKQNQLPEAVALLEKVICQIEHSHVSRVLAGFLLDALNYKRIVELPAIQKYDPRSYVIAKSFLAGDILNTDPICLDGHHALEKVAFIAMIKDEEDVIFFNLLWHYELGLRKFFLIDNLSTDRTLESIKLFEQIFTDTQVFILHDPVIAHYQGKKITGACRFAMSLWNNLEWLILSDADEFLCPMQPLHSIFENIPETIDAVIVPKSFYNLFPGESAEDNDFFFRRIRHRTPVTHISSKAIMRANPQFTVSQGNHHIFDQDNNEIHNYLCNLNLTYREFRMRSHTHYKKKVLNGGRAVEAAKQQGFAQVGGGHWEALYKLYLKQGEMGLHRHLVKFIEKESSRTTIQDPLPLDKIIAKMDSGKKISQLIGKN